MSPNRRWKLREIQPDCTGDGAEFVEFVRSHDPEMMGPLTVALSQRRTLFSWLTPGKRVLGLPDWVDQNLQWLTLVDDLGVAATGPNSFDHLSLSNGGSPAPTSLSSTRRRRPLDYTRRQGP